MKDNRTINLSPKFGLNPIIAVCFFCHKDRGDLAIVGKLPGDKEAPMRAVVDLAPCAECKAKIGDGVALIEADPTTNKPTGRFAVVTQEAMRNVFTEDDPLVKSAIAKRGAFIDPATFKRLGIEEAVRAKEQAAVEHYNA